MTRETVDGSDVWRGVGGVRRFLRGARRGEGPLLLECLTHRRRGHYEGDAAGYRDALGRGGVGSAAIRWRGCARTRSPRAGSTTPRSRRSQAEASDEVEEAVAFARESPFPGLELMEQLVYAEG